MLMRQIDELFAAIDFGCTTAQTTLNRVVGSFVSAINNTLMNISSTVSTELKRKLTAAVQQAKQTAMAAMSASAAPLRLSAFDISTIVSDIINSVTATIKDTITQGLAKILDGGSLLQSVQSELESAILSLVDLAIPQVSRFVTVVQNAINKTREIVTGITSTVDEVLETIGIPRQQMIPVLTGNFSAGSQNFLGNAVEFITSKAMDGMTFILPIISKGFGAIMNAVTRVQIKLTEIESEIQGYVNKAFGVVTNVQDLSSEYIQGAIEQAVSTVNQKVDQILDNVPVLLQEALQNLTGQSSVATKVVQNATNVVFQHLSDSAQALVTKLGLTLSNTATEILHGAISIGQIKETIVNRMTALMNEGLAAIEVTEDLIQNATEGVLIALQNALESVGDQIQYKLSALVSAARQHLNNIAGNASRIVSQQFSSLTTISDLNGSRASYVVDRIANQTREELVALIDEMQSAQVVDEITAIFQAQFGTIGGLTTLVKPVVNHVVNASLSTLRMTAERVPSLVAQKLQIVISSAVKANKDLLQVKEQVSAVLSNALTEAALSLELTPQQVK